MQQMLVVFAWVQGYIRVILGLYGVCYLWFRFRLGGLGGLKGWRSAYL